MTDRLTHWLTYHKSWLCLALGVLVAIALSSPVAAQVDDFTATQNSPAISSPADPATPSPPTQEPTENLTSPNPGLNRLVPDQWVIETSVIDSAPIYLDGRIIFQIAAPTLPQQPVAEERAQEIQRRVNEVTRDLSSQPPTVSVSVDSASGLPIIVADNKLLTTVTYQDAQLSGYANPSSLSIALAEDLRTAFDRYLKERSPEFLSNRIKMAIGILVATALVQVSIRRLIYRLKRRQVRLVGAKTHLGPDRRSYPTLEIPYVPGFNSVFEQIKARLDNRQKRKLNETMWGLLALLQPLLWVGSLLSILYLFPYSRWLTVLSLYWLKIPAQIFLLSGLAYIAVRLSSLLIDKISLAFQSGTRWAPDRSQRLNLRFATLSQVIKGLVGIIILATTLLLMLSTAGVQVAPLLAGAGIVGIGVSLAAQSLIKDLINGFLILFEDHFGVGDVVSIEGLMGTVEHVNLRITQLRDTEGKLITIPNSQIGIVQNLSMDWAQIDLRVTVSAHSDLNQVSALLKAIAADLSQDEKWQRHILEPPDLLGVEALDYTGITLRMFLKTQPLEQWHVARELRRRIKEAFEKAGIHMGVAQEKVSIQMFESPVSEPGSIETDSDL